MKNVILFNELFDEEESTCVSQYLFSEECEQWANIYF